MSSSHEATGGAGAPADTSDRKGKQRFSSGGKRYLLVLRAPYGQPIDRFVLRWTGFSPMTAQYGLLGGAGWRRAFAAGRRALLLTTIGRRTGRLRTTALPYTVHGEHLVVCGTNGGGPRDPYWVDNVRASGHVWIRVPPRHVPADAHVAEGAERAEVFEALAGSNRGLRHYQRQTEALGRDVPLVMIRPREPIAPR